jgi:hypothetical protein
VKAIQNVLEKKSDALVGRVWTFHILQTSIEKAFSIFRKIHSELLKFQENKVLKTLLQSLSFEILFFSSQKQTDLTFLTFFEKISKIYQENSQAKLKNLTLVSIDKRQVAKHDQAEFQPATQTDLDLFLTFFKKKNSEFFRNTLKRISKNSKFECPFLFVN